MIARFLDRWLYRHPFEGRSARRYLRAERPAFGDLDAGLCERWHADLAGAQTLLDIGAGPGTFVATARARFPGLQVVAIEPSRTLVAVLAAGGSRPVRARGEALPLAEASIDVAVSISSIRHVADRHATLVELRRVVRPGGCAWVVELDPAADRRRTRAHADRLDSAVLRAGFAPLVLRTAPPVATIIALARGAGWATIDRDDDPVQPLYRLRLS